MDFRRHIETNSFKSIFLLELFCLLLVSTACVSTSGLVEFLDFPIKARTDRTLTDLGPLCAGRTRNIHIE